MTPRSQQAQMPHQNDQKRIKQSAVRFVVGASLLLPSLAFGPIPSCAQDSTQPQSTADARKELKKVENAVRESEETRQALEAQATAAQQQVLEISQQLVAGARRVQTAEADATRLEAQINFLTDELNAKTDALHARQDELSTLLGTLISLSRRPAATSLLEPGQAVKTARSAAVMGKIVPQIQTLTQALSQELTAMADLQDSLSGQRFNLEETLARLAEENRLLADLRARKESEALTAQLESGRESQRITTLKDKAADLKSLIEALIKQAEKDAEDALKQGRNRPDAPPAGFMTTPFSKARGTLTAPARGRIITQFGDRTGPSTARGMTIQTRSGAQIVAPFDGKIVYAGTYRTYGQILIISHKGGYHSLLAGLDQIYLGREDWVLAGEPVGALKEDPLEDPALYLEIRQKGQAIDPAPWLRKNSLEDTR